jgi:hypothetical protein
MKHRDMQEQTNQYAENKQICMQKRYMKTDVQPLADKQMCIHTRRHEGWLTSRPEGKEEDKHV